MNKLTNQSNSTQDTDRMRRCEHLDTRLFTREGAEHTGLDLFACCQRCGFEGIDFPHIECNPNEITPKMRATCWTCFTLMPPPSKQRLGKTLDRNT